MCNNILHFKRVNLTPIYMRKKSTFFLRRYLNGFVLFFIPFLSVAQYYPPSDPTYLLSTTYSDEFNGTKKSMWSSLGSGDHFADGTFESGEIHFNSETVSGQTRNYLQLTATRKTDSSGNYYYATGGIQVPYYSSPYYYGYYEIEARASISGSKSTTQLFPAFWTWNANGSPSWYEEMDIFEEGPPYLKNNNLDVHYWYRRPDYGFELFPQEGLKSGIDMTSWHTYGLEWDVDKLIYYVDGVPFYTVLPNPSIDVLIPSHSNKYLLIDLQVTNYPNPLDFTSAALGSMDVNYFRYYTMKKSNSSCGSLDLYTISSNTDLTNYLNPSNNLENLKKTITIGSGTAISVPSGTTVTMRATDEFDINGDFTVPLGSELDLIPSVCY
ncbi:MAG: hypothetical protein JWO58_2971 [Chitinophagaceae bacterium]|nr:hypothetical protein [Chitinophagaceae bacterium]